MTAPRHPTLGRRSQLDGFARVTCSVLLITAVSLPPLARADAPPDSPPARGPRVSLVAATDHAPRPEGAVPHLSPSAGAASIPPPPTLLRQDDLGHGSRLGAWVTLGSGVAAVVVGGVLYGLSAGRAEAANRASLGGDRTAYERHLDAYELERGFSWGLLSVGTAAVGVGALMLLLDDDLDVSAEPGPVKAVAAAADEPSVLDVEVRSIHVRPLRRGGLLSMRGRF